PPPYPVRTWAGALSAYSLMSRYRVTRTRPRDRYLTHQSPPTWKPPSMCHPASPGSAWLGNRTGIDPPTPRLRHHRPSPISWSNASHRIGWVPAAANASLSGHEMRTTGSRQVDGSSRRTPWSPRSDQISSWHAQHAGGHRAPDGDEPVRGERVDLGLAEH